MLALVGRSGAGKSTLLKLVNRLLLPDEGAVLVEGRDTREWEPIALRRNVGYVLQDVGLFPHMSVADNVAVVPRLERWSAARVDARVNELLEPDKGDVLVEGKPTREWEPIRLRRRVGYVLQDVGLFPHMTVRGNIGVVAQLEGWPAARVGSRVDELLDLIGLDRQTFAHRWPDELSGGQRQRVGVARALAVDPPMLLMDEPFGALDPITRVELHEEFARIQSRVRKTVVMVTHDMREAFAMASRIGVLDHGRLIALDAVDRLRSSTDPRVRRLLDA